MCSTAAAMPASGNSVSTSGRCVLVETKFM
jgi:hypothetical protein